MPNFTKTEIELESHYDEWLYALKNLPNLENRPEKLKERIFHRSFEAAEIAKYKPKEKKNYEQSIKIYRDLKNSLDTARMEGGLEAKIAGILKSLKKGPSSLVDVADIFNVPVEFVQKIKSDNNL